MHDGEHRYGTANDRQHGRLKVAQTVLQVSNRWSLAEGIEPVEVETGAKVTARADEQDDSGLTGFFNLLDLLRQPAGHPGSERVPASRPVEGEPVNRPVRLRHQLGHATSR